MNAWLSNVPILADWSIRLIPDDIAPDKKFALVVVFLGCITGVLCTFVVTISGMINSMHRRRVEAEMKREMIERGMSADEIIKIIESASPPEDGAQRWIASWANRKK